MIRQPPRSPPFPYRTLSQSASRRRSGPGHRRQESVAKTRQQSLALLHAAEHGVPGELGGDDAERGLAKRRVGHLIGRDRVERVAVVQFVEGLDRSEEHTSELSHANISYAVFCLK